MIYRILRALVVPKALRMIQRIDGDENIPADHPFILASNHVSWLDPIYLTAAVGTRFHGRLLFIAATMKHWWTQAVIPIQKRNPAGCLDGAVRHLERGHAIGIFPRGDQRKVLDTPRTGAARLARRSGCPVIPTAILGAHPGHTLRSILDYFQTKQSLVVRFGEPIFIDTAKNPGRNIILADAMRIDRAMQSLLTPP
jgi:1-acyl-sn-glycerol-3-phosphate acyltransferase